jgi:osmotically inducible lipoprotein OsmB
MPTENMTRTGRKATAALALASVLTFGACSVDSKTGERTLTGAGVGAAGGAAVGLISGGFLSSTLTGAAAGAAGGFVYDQIRRNQ